MITNKSYNVDHAKSSDRKLVFEFALILPFDKKASCRKSTMDQSFVRLLKSPAVVARMNMPAKPSVHAVYEDAKTGLSSSDPIELCDREKLLLQEKEEGIISNVINRKNIPSEGKLIKYKSISTKHIHKVLNLAFQAS